MKCDLQGLCGSRRCWKDATVQVETEAMAQLTTASNGRLVTMPPRKVYGRTVRCDEHATDFTVAYRYLKRV